MAGAGRGTPWADNPSALTLPVSSIAGRGRWCIQEHHLSPLSSVQRASRGTWVKTECEFVNVFVE